MAKNFCPECRFFDKPINEVHAQPRGDRAGWCRRYAPKPLVGGSGTGWADYEWPSVYSDDWCGEWEKADG
jgi:hypothetical protein